MEYHGALIRARYYPHGPLRRCVHFQVSNRPHPHPPHPGLALAPWGVLCGGRLRTDEEEARRRESGENGRTILHPNWERNEDEKKISAALEKVANEVGTKHITAGEYERQRSQFRSTWVNDVSLPLRSRHSIRDAKGAIRPPHRWRTKD